MQATRDLPDSQKGTGKAKREEMDIKGGSEDAEYISHEDRERDIQELIASLRAHLQVEFPLLPGMPPTVALLQPEGVLCTSYKQCFVIYNCGESNVKYKFFLYIFLIIVIYVVRC